MRIVVPIDATLQYRKEPILNKTKETIREKQIDRIQIPLQYVVKSRMLEIVRKNIHK